MVKNSILYWSITIALGGFLFGFDTAVISGAEQAIQKVWSLNVFEHGLTVSIALIGTVFGALLGGIPSDKLGRKKTLLWIALFYFISAIGSAIVSDWYMFLFFRFLGGLGVGASSVTAPMYISEISPANRRGRLVALFQFNIVFGILIAYVSNYLLSGLLIGTGWRWMLGVEALPALAFFIMIFGIPESPRWLILKKNLIDKARETIKIINPDGVEGTIEAIKQSGQHAVNVKHAKLFSFDHFKIPIMLAVLFAMFNQLSGINAIIYYAPRVFAMTGLGTESALLSTAGIGVVNFLFTLLALNYIDKFGRKKLMYIGSVGLIATLGWISFTFYSGNFTGYIVPALLFVYIGFFAFSQGAVIWVFISEIFPNQVRASGQSLGSSTHWIMAAIIAFTFPAIAENLGGGTTFLIFTIMMVLQLLFVWKLMPETKGKSLEQIEEQVEV